MNRVSFISCALAICCLNSYGQTNSSPATRPLFSPPTLRLRPLSSEPEKLEQARTAVSSEERQSATPVSKPEKISADVGSVAIPNILPGQMSLTRAEKDLDLEIYRRLEQGGYLTRREPRSENVFVRGMGAIWNPEAVQIGKISVSCPIITAIKRKNPLCLINPMVLSASW